MADTYWAKLHCDNGVISPQSIFVNACGTASIGSTFNHPMGGFTSISCNICFDKTGSGFSNTNCVNAGTLNLTPRCTCADMPTVGAWSSSQPTCNPPGTKSYNFAGSAGMCYACDYPQTAPGASFAPVGPMGSMAFTG